MIRRHMLTLIAAFFWLGGPALAQEEKLNILIGDVRAFDLRENPVLAGREGDVAALSRWPDVRPHARARRAAINARFAKRLAAINTSRLDAGAKVNADLLDFVLHDRLARARFDEAAMPFTNDSGFHTDAGYLARSTRATNVQEAEAWIARLNALPTYFEQNMDNLRAGIDEGITQPQLVVDAVIATLKATLADQDFAKGFAAPFNTLPAGMADAEKTALQERLNAAITDKVRPAYENLLQFFEEEYRPEARSSIGISDVPGGAAYYADLVKIFTTTDMTPAQVHDLGRSEVARIRKEMEKVILQSGFEGTFAEFLNFLRTDPQFYAKTPGELLRHAAWIAKKADDQMPKMFSKLPRLPYGVRPVPAAIAPHYTTARYWPGDARNHRAGGYMVNTYALDQRPLYELPALTLHEAVPGHHHQIALAQELKNVPAFRKDLYLTAFGEGWGLYAEKLGIEMGMYTTPYENFGRLTYEMWRACRLVMDTGIHAMGWTRDQAMKCLQDNSALSLHNIETETDRYIAWPGQALGYKIGELTILRLRKKAETALGENFDLRAFHDEVLSDGSITMAMLEAKIDRWIKGQE
ncbi:MAG: DUF885 family protein [Robiginitomaculum sp.]|nr:DUF885 family protein [Robiginitomaculum sp.]